MTKCICKWFSEFMSFSSCFFLEDVWSRFSTVHTGVIVVMLPSHFIRIIVSSFLVRNWTCTVSPFVFMTGKLILSSKSTFAVVTVKLYSFLTLLSLAITTTAPCHKKHKHKYFVRCQFCMKSYKVVYTKKYWVRLYTFVWISHPFSKTYKL